MSNSRKVSLSLRKLISRALGGSHHIEPLEPRTLLSASLDPASSLVDWGGTQMTVRNGSYVLTFDQAYGNERAELIAREAATRLGVQATDFKGIGRGRYASFSTTTPLTKQQADTLSFAMGELVSLEPNAVYQPSRIPNDPLFAEQWWLSNTGQNIGGLGTIGADIGTVLAWDTTIGSPNVIVAVIDTGIDLTHPDLIPNLWVNPGEIPGNGLDDDGNGFIDDVHGYDFGEGDGSPQDVAGHGTAVAGTIGAAGNNGIGVAGVNWDVQLMGLKIADRFGGLTLAAIIGAHDYATMMRERSQQGIDIGGDLAVSNNSYGGFNQAFYADAPTGFAAERDAIQRFINSGATFVAAAGNNNFDNDNEEFTFFPSSYNIPGLISVAATDNNDALAGFSNYGQRTVHLAAPGVDVFTTAVGGGYAYIDGTSFASPAVAGAVALLKAHKPGASAVEIREALINSSDLLPGMQGRVESGGRINVARALQFINIAGPAVRAVSPGPVTGQLSSATNTPVNTVTVTFSKDISLASLSTLSATLVGDGVDNTFGTGDDRVIPITGVTLSSFDPRTVTFTLNLTGFAQQRLPIDNYRLTVKGTGANAVKDVNGNFLNGNTSTGTDHVYDFRVAPATGDTEPNDTLATATPVSFDSTGQAAFNGVTVGNGLQANLDIDLYRLDLSRGGLITAEIFAKRLPAPSTLDSYIRLFDANGVEIASNDQTFGQDSFIDFFVFTGGTYYIGVSGFGNADYDPQVAGSGTSQSLGVYNLRLNVALQTNDTLTFNATDPALPRPVPFEQGQTQGTTSSFIDITDTRQIIDLNVKFDITHSFDQDLEISLIGPDNTQVILVNRRGGSGQNFTNTILDDEAPADKTIGTASAPFTGVFRPDQPLGAFDGKVGAGRWTLVVRDRANLNSGFLNSWSLTFTFKNNIFGPFEANDTIASAKPLAEISGTGTATRAAFIGDGGFGNLDRDIYRFNADAGSSLTAVVTSNGSLNTAVRLFDATGTQILFSSPSNSLNSSIDNYVFANSGTYYIAVSEGGNTAYDPTVVASGVVAQSTGNYTMTVFLAAGVSDPGAVLTGNPLTIGVGPDGTFSQSGVGARFNGTEFFGESFLGLVVNGNSFANSSTGGNELPLSLTSSGDFANNRISTKANHRGLDVDRVISYGHNDSFMAIDVFFTNITGGALNDVAWMEGFNPQQGLGLGQNNAATLNDVSDSGKAAFASYITNQFAQGLTVALVAPESDSRVQATVIPGSTVVRDPSLLLAQAPNDPNGTSTDGKLVLAYDLGNIAPGQTVAVRYFVFFGNTPAAVESQIDAMNNGTGTGHLTANPATPASETLDSGTTIPETVPTLPYRVYYPEGFFGDNIYTFVPISNLSDQPATVYVIARYETGVRDQLVGQLTIGANARSGLTITTPELFNSGGALAGRANAPFALEVRSDRPVSATFSHYDLGILAGHQAAIGESFTSETRTDWSFPSVSKGIGGTADFIVFYNPTDTFSKVTGRFYPATGGAPFQTAFNLEAFRRGGWAVNDLTIVAGYTFTQPFTLQSDYVVTFSRQSLGFTTINGAQIAEGTVIPAGTVISTGSVIANGNAIPTGEYGATIQSEQPIVASVSHYDFSEFNAAGSIGNSGFGAPTGVIPEGQFGLNTGTETVAVLNGTNAETTAVITFIFANGSSVSRSLTVPANSQRVLNVAEIPNFPTNQAYGLTYETTNGAAVSVSLLTRGFGDAQSSATTATASTVWGFAEGFRPGDGDNHPGVTDLLRLYNPSDFDVTVEITIGYDGVPGTETFRRTLPARRVTEFNMDQFITGDRRLSPQWFGTRIKAPTPIVAYMSHYDRAFVGLVPDDTPGAAFGTLGTPLGRTGSV